VRVASAWLDDDYISEATREQFWTPMRLNSGEVNEQGYALGWRVNPESTSRFGEDAPVRIVHHGGVSRGAMSWLILYPELGIAVAVNINTEADEFSDFSSVEPEITRLFAEAAGRTPEGARRPD
jgi:CubicO group peptidase (beta-lactamase class C family)